ncbi:MAG: hypothetical protein ACOCV7_03635 [Desulfonatronovibrionaceae bacterium]
MTFDANFSLEDIDAWIGCSDVHGELIWSRSGLFNALCNVFAAEMSGRDRLCSQKYYDDGATRIGEVFERLKKNKDQKYFGFFTDQKHFFRYILMSMKGLQFNEQGRIKMEVPLDDNNAGHVLDYEFEDDWLSRHQLEFLKDKAGILVQDFLEWIETTRAKSLKSHFHEIIRAYSEYNEIYIVGFMDTGSNADLN